MKLWNLIFAFGILAGCSLPVNLSPSSKTYYRLGEMALNDTPAPSTRPEHLLVRDMIAPSYLESQRIVFSEGDGKLGSFQFAFWVETPPQELTSLLLQGIDRRKLFQAVSRSSTGSTGEFQLNSELIDFVFDPTGRPDVVRVAIRVELIDLDTRLVVRSKEFRREEEALESDADGAVRALRIASRAVLEEILSWLQESCATIPAGMPLRPRDTACSASPRGLRTET